MGIKLNDIADERLRQRIRLALGAGGGIAKPATGLTPATRRTYEMNPATARPSISTDEAKLNKTERAFHEWLKRQGFLWIGVQNMTIKLAFDTRYTPDFVSYDGIEGTARVTFWEVKGHWRR